MDPQEKEKQPSMDLPPIEGDPAYNPLVEQQGAERNPELLPPVRVDDPVTQPQSGSPQTAQTISQDSSVGGSALQSAQTPAIADDVDLIEKEWVEKAKEIVEKTKDNPYLQNKAISEFKADYIKKRYNKELAKSDE